ncbi:UDP-N-acetylmuramate dehydrogenase [Limnothrix redekei]|uniref:UDP-N-acetylenolpyruvoylglucosamine reductase n=1 Tax=Limnothrix redekei LRLZ20PSL1 TaxID=3112953 RepID=A0ABW7C7E9_9CYAN
MVTQLHSPATKTGSLIQSNVSLARFTSFRVGGPAEWYAAPKTLDDLYECFEWADRNSVPVTLLGAGSNLLISDRGISGLTIGTRYLRRIQIDRENARIKAGAGVSMAALAWKAAYLGWSGLEWSVGIPGSIGGSIVMNAGAHGSEIRDVLLQATVLAPQTGQIQHRSSADLGYSYRTSSLQGDSQLVTEATFQLQPGHDSRALQAQTREHLERRHATQPYHLPSCGSVFRNPEPRKAGWLIEQSGLKGHRIGGAEVAQMHANFILNRDNATATDIFNLIDCVRNEVYSRWDVLLEPEVRMLGPFCAV